MAIAPYSDAALLTSLNGMSSATTWRRNIKHKQVRFRRRSHAIRLLNTPCVLVLIGLVALISPGMVFMMFVGKNINRNTARWRLLGSSHEQKTQAGDTVFIGRGAFPVPTTPPRDSVSVAPATAQSPSTILEMRVNGSVQEVERADKPNNVEVARSTPSRHCLRNLLWDKEVDTSVFDYGCKEIKEMLAGDKQLMGHYYVKDVYMVKRWGRTLAVKALDESDELRRSKDVVENINRCEAAALEAVRGHPNIVDLLGVCESSSVSEFFPTRLDEFVFGDGAKPRQIPSVVSMALDAARGVQALHEASGGPIIHFDIKPKNFVLDGEGKLKIYDLSLCKFVDTDADGNICALESPASRAGPWRSPENIAGEDISEKVDVYSLAMVFYAMLTLMPPYSGERNAKALKLNGIPPMVDPSWHSGFMEIVRDMWQRDPKMRPSARRVVERLEMLQKDLLQTL